MKVQLRYLSGARTGQSEVFHKGYIGLGRHPMSDARFDADRDLDVSSRHAAIVQRGTDQFVLRDLGSKNGTFLNGKQVTGDVTLTEGDVIGFGSRGPTVEFHVLEHDAPEMSPGVRASANRISAPREEFPAVDNRRAGVSQPSGEREPGERSTAVRVAAEVRRQTHELRRASKVLLVMLLLVAVGFGWVQWHSARDARALVQLQTRADSLTRASQRLVAQFQSELDHARAALRDAQDEGTKLRAELAQAGATADPATVSQLRNRLDSTAARQRGLSDALGVDYRGIAHNNVDAVAIIIVKHSDNNIVTGTAFAVDSQGTLVTNKHVLVGEGGNEQPLEIGVKFSGSKQWFKSTLLGVADSADVAIVRVEIRGGTPRVLGLASGPGSALERGDPVAIIGFPLGEDLPMDRQAQSAIADPTLSVGTVSKVLADVIQLDGYGAPGSSGSPVFDRDGRVVGVLYGGERASQGRIVYAVPGRVIAGLLHRVGSARRGH